MVEIDMSDVIPEQMLAALSESMVVHILDSVATSARAKWIRLAQTELQTSRQSYIQGIQDVESEGPMERSITLLGWLPNAIENGLAPFDMRETLLGPGSSIRKPIFKSAGKGRSGATLYEATGQYYAHVPIRHGTPGTTGLAGLPMGEAYGERGPRSRAVGGGMGPKAIMNTERAQAFGEAVYGAAKQLRSKRKMAGGKYRAPDRLHAPDPLLKSHHKTSIYHGMTKVRKPYRNPDTGKTTVQSQYTTFRTISDANKTGWMHPGIEPRKLSTKVADHAADVMHAAVRVAYAKAIKKVT
ncbi:MAG: hypothetical protein KJN79_01180 [Gammaproteobacteria bacterium]|nr:hypothetical protein [Gammaproteobacteria bacterium]